MTRETNSTAVILNSVLISSKLGNSITSLSKVAKKKIKVLTLETIQKVLRRIDSGHRLMELAEIAQRVDDDKDITKEQKTFTTKRLSDAFGHFDTLCSYFCENDPDEQCRTSVIRN